MDALPNTMRAWTITKAGPYNSVLKFWTDRPVPHAPSGSDLLVKVSYAALNPADAKLMQTLPSWLPTRRNPVPGLDFAGTVVRAGPSAATVAADVAAPGTMVCGTFGVMQVAFGGGSLAEYVVVPAGLVAPAPRGISVAAASGLGVVGQTAVVMVRDAGDLVRKGSRVLVNGASGGVGTVLIQVLAAKGVEIVAVCSSANEALVRRLGASEIVDYKIHKPLETYLASQYGSKPFDIIYDCVGSSTLYSPTAAYVTPKSMFINIVGGRSRGIAGSVRDLLPTALGGTPSGVRHIAVSPTGKLMREAAAWVEDGVVKEVPVDSEYAMEDVIKAFDRVVSQRSKGKVVVRLAGD